ncbi:hypothetical protein JCM1841_001533 [Sporobolomyces salmonicolor]
MASIDLSSRLEALPVELQLQILSHLPLHSTAIRSQHALFPLALTSRTLHQLVSPLLNSHIRLRSVPDACAFLSAPRHLKQHVTSLVLARPSSPSSRRDRPLWPLPLLSQLVEFCSLLAELRIEGGLDDPAPLLAALHPLSCDSSVALERLELDFDTKPASAEDAVLPNERADHPRNVLAGPSASDRARVDPALAGALSSLPLRSGRLNPLAAYLKLFPELTHLRLRNLDCRDSTSPPWNARLLREPGSPPPSSNLRHLELDRVKISDEDLLELFDGTRGSVEGVVLRECSGFSKAGLVEALGMVGGKLKMLELVAPVDALPSTPSPSPYHVRPPLSNPPSPVRSPARPPSPAPPCLVNIVDSLLPSLLSLECLSLSGPLLSPHTLFRLPALTPHLRRLSLAAHPALRPSHLLPLVASSLALPSLRHLELHTIMPSTSDASPLAHCASTFPYLPRLSSSSTDAPSPEEEDATTELWGVALGRNVELRGEVFERVGSRLRWATEAAERVAGKEGDGTGEAVQAAPVRRRKRPGIAAC